MKDDQDKTLTIDAGEETSLDTSSVPEPKATGEVVDLPEDVESTEETAESEETAETADNQKKGYNQRVRELVKERNQAKAEAQSLAERLAEITGSVEPQLDPRQVYQPLAEPGEISPEKYQQDVLRTADSIVTLRMKQQEAITKVNNDAIEVVKAYPQLDPESDSFDPELSNSITVAAEGYIAKNPYSANVKKFVDNLMKPYQRAVNKEVGKVTENVAKQVSEAALKPTFVRQSEKTPEEMSIVELEQELGVVQG